MACWECKHLEPSYDNHGLNGFKYYWCPISKTDSSEAVWEEKENKTEA
jgi:hypothetical protein